MLKNPHCGVRGPSMPLKTQINAYSSVCKGQYK